MALFDDLIPSASGKADRLGAGPRPAVTTGMFDDLIPADDGSGLVDSIPGGRTVVETMKGVPEGAVTMGGTILKGAAAQQKGAQHSAAELGRQQLAVMDRIDRGEPVPETEDVIGYQHMTPEQRREARAELEQAQAAFDPGTVEDSSLYRSGQAVQDYGETILPAEPGYEDSISRNIGRGLGSVATGVAASALGGPVAAGTAFSLAGASEAVDRAVQAGATEEQIIAAAKSGQFAGMTDSLPVEVLLGRVPLPGGQLIKVPVGMIGDALRVGQRIGFQALVEGIQEGGQEFIQNAIQQTYDEDQPLVEGVAEGAGLGAAVGGITEALLTPARRRGGRPASQQQAPGTFDDLIPEGAQPAEDIIGAETEKGDRLQPVTPEQPIAPEAVPGDTERASSPRLTPEDRASPIPNDLIDDGKALIGQTTGTEAAPVPENIAALPPVAPEGGPLPASGIQPEIANAAPAAPVAETGAISPDPESDTRIDAVLQKARQFSDPIDVAMRASQDEGRTYDDLSSLRAEVRQAERTLMRKYGVRRVDELDDAPLTDAERNFLFHDPAPVSREEIDSLIAIREPVEDLNEASIEISRTANRLPDTADIDAMTGAERNAVARLIFLGSEVERLGGNRDAVLMDALKAQASRFSDPQDAEFMARSIGERLARFVGTRPPASPEAAALPAPSATGENGKPTRKSIERRDIDTDTAVTASGRSVPVQYAVVEASSLVPSQKDEGGANPAYPAEMQPRDRSRAVSESQIQSIAKNLNPRLLDKSPRASDGAPIISADGVVESGNGRVLAIRRAYQAGNAEAYRQHLADQGYPVDGMDRPVLVRVRQGELSPDERQAFTREANERDTLAMSATEQAMADAAAMSDDLVSLYRGGDVDQAGNRDFVRAFIRDVVNPNDQARMIGSDGALSQEAVRRVQAGLLGKAYGDPDLVASLVESTDTNIKAIGGALTDVAAEWAQMRAEAASGAINPEVDQTNRLLEAVRLVDRARREGQKLVDLVGQRDIFSGQAIDPVAEAFLRLMFRNQVSWTMPVGRDKLADKLRFYVTEARKTTPGVDLLGQAPASSGQILEAIGDRDRGQEQQQEGLALRPPAAAAVGEDVRPDGGRGAQQDQRGRAAQGGAEGARAGDQPAGEVSQAGTKARDKVVAAGRKDGIEHLSVVGADGKVVSEGAGKANFVSFPPGLVEKFLTEGADLVAHHNHPAGTSLSRPDISFLAYPGLTAVWAHGHEGTSARASLTKAAREKVSPDDNGVRAIARMTSARAGAIRGVLQAAVSDREITPAEASLADSIARNVAAHRAGIIDYVDNIPWHPILTSRGVQNAIEDEATNAAKLFFGRKARIRDYDRPSVPVRHAGDVGIISEDAARPAGQRPAQDDAAGRSQQDADGDGQDLLTALREEPFRLDDRQDAMQGFIARGQPLDRAIRLPFAIFGGIDREGQWKPGKYLTDSAARVITSAKFSPEGRFSWMNGALETARAGLIDRYGLDPAYVDRERKRALDERRTMLKGAEILKTLQDGKVGPEEARVLQAVLTGENVADADMKRLAVPIRQAIDELGQEAVSLGLLSPEAYERNRGAYLHRVYARHEAEQNALSKMVGKMMGRSRKKIIGDQFKGRGIFLDVGFDRLTKDDPEWKEGRRGKPGKGEKFRILDRVQDDMQGGKAKVTDRVFWPADRKVPKDFEAYRDSGTWEIRGERGGKAVLWRDYTKAEREKMGEIMDARYTIGKTFMLMAHDLATGRFYKDIAENEEWARSTEPATAWKDAGEVNRYAIDPALEWVRVPETAIPDSGGKKRWGGLAGKWVRAEIWRDLNEIDIMSRPTTWRTLLTQWKLNKTARSPVVHMNNVMSNMVFMDLADIRAQDLVAGMRSYIKGDRHYEEAAANGAFGSDMMSQEIRDNVLKPILDEITRDMQAGTANSFLARAKMMGKFADRLWTWAKTADRKMIDAYRAEDEVFRMATYMRRRQIGDSPKDAADFARQQFLDYDIRAPWVNAARNSVLPFLSYTYRAAPLVAKAIVTRPWKLGKYFAVAYALNALAYAWDDEGDEEKERASLRDEEQGFTWIGVPRMMRMPFRNEDGLPVFLDIRRWIPAGDIFDTGQGSSAIPIPAPLQFGGPLMIGAEIALNKQGFTGEEITNDLTDTWFEKAGKIGDYLWKAWLPSAAWVPGSWYWEKIGNAAKGATDASGRPYDLPSAAASSVGIKLKPQDVEQGLHWQGYGIQKVEQELKAQARRLARQRERNLISKDEFEKGMRSITTKFERLEDRARKLQDAASR
ncbi:MAG: hypothetical protein K5872_22345 [Rhizobiaceae bacterium]|nr:hypothetical protein [Rhizobiaceae bacterium]MCV0408962.1 hypothetical protein [Rhizobiaceae bacterium]